MKKLWLLLIIAFALGLLTGCGTDNAAEEQKHMMEEELNPENDNSNSDLNDKLGYVRYTKDQIQTDVENNNLITINRTKLANMITRTILQHDGITEGASLVTDEEVLVVYSTDDGMDSKTAAFIAKRSVRSIMPNHFEVYVSEKEKVMQDIQRLHNSSVEEDNYDDQINKIIHDMK